MNQTHEEWIKHWGAPHDHEEWRDRLTHLTGNFVNWKLSWMSGRAIVRGLEKYFIELMGLKGIQPYAPLRILRQFGLVQDVPLWSWMALFEE